MSDEQLEILVDRVRANPKYQSISQDLIRRLAEDALQRGLSGKSAVKAVRNKLHQVGGAYFKKDISYDQFKKELTNLPGDLQSEQVKSFCTQVMQTHASTAERLPILDEFFHTCLEPIAPVSSIVDLACGMNPFAIPWMPLAQRFAYNACDIYLDMLGLVQVFFNQNGINGQIGPCDLVDKLPKTDVQVAFLLKSIPCLEQVDKEIGVRLLNAIKAQHILVSFPVRSLGGQKKGMFDFYREHFYEIIGQNNWLVREFSFTTELAFLVTK